MTPARSPGAEAWIQALLVLVIGCFYLWTSVPEPGPALVAKTNDSYYNLLTRGFLKGQLSLDVPADPYLATLKNPSDPRERGNHGMHDVSYFRGKYYIYFGVAPAVLVFLPFRLLTGRYLDDSLAVPLLAFAGFLLSVLLLRAMRTRYFRAAPVPAVAGGVLALGLANLVPMLLRRTSVWEVPIASGYFCCMGGLYALFQAWHSRHRLSWLAAASAAFGFAVGSRPTYLAGCGALLIAFFSLWQEAGATSRARRLRLLLAAVLPIATVGAGLALYNYLRFGSLADFGWRHLLNADQVSTAQIFGGRFLWYNLRVYGLAPAGWSPYFPYVALAHVPPAPAGFMDVEDPYGVLPNIPFVLLGAVAVFGLRRFEPGEARRRLQAFALAVLAAAAGTGLLTSCFAAAINRYMVDFLPAFVLLAVIGFLVVVTRPWFRGGIAWLGGGALGLLLAYSVLFNILVSFRHNELFRAEHPSLYRRVARLGGYPSFALDRLRGTAYGPLELKVIFPENKVGLVEPLVVTGRDFLSDYLFVHYLGPGLVRFGLDHTSRGALIGQPVRIKPGEVQTLRIDLGSLYPPAADPSFDAWPPAEARLRQETLRVTINGQVVLDRRQLFYDASSRGPSLGSSGDRPGFTAPFSGKIVSSRRLPGAPLTSTLGGMAGPVRLELTLPAFTGVQSEPLLTTGETGHGDLIYVRYLSATEIAFGYDHWSLGGKVSAPITVNPRAVQVIEIDSGALHPEGAMGETPAEISSRPLVLRLNGRTVFDEPAPFWTCDPSTVSVAVNAIQASTASALFSGTLVKAERLPAPR